MAFARKPQNKLKEIYLNNHKLDQISRISYLSSIILSDCKDTKEIKRHMNYFQFKKNFYIQEIKPKHREKTHQNVCLEYSAIEL